MSETNKDSRYTPAPKLTDQQLVRRYDAVLQALSGQMTVSEAARRLEMSRNHFQAVMHRGMRGLLDGISPKEGGRPPKPKREASLEQELQRLQAENARLKEQNQVLSRVLNFASEVAKSTRPPRRGRTVRTPAVASEVLAPSDEPDGAPRLRLQRALGLCAEGVPARLAAALVNASPPTLRRWKRRHTEGSPIVWRRGVKRLQQAPAAALAHQVTNLVRCTHGLIGADALRHAVPGVSRRQASAIKRLTLRTMERDRVASCERVHVTELGVMRGMDQLFCRTERGKTVILGVADAAVPLLTTMRPVPAYDAHHVREVLAADMDQNGVPLVYRLDQARSHRAEVVRDFLAERGVLVLHGPARLPRFYGQLERLNRDARTWLPRSAGLAANSIQWRINEALTCLNEVMPRRSLGWKTPAEAARERGMLLNVDRYEVLAEVAERAARMREHTTSDTQDDVIERMAIEAMLMSRGWLIREAGGWC